MRYRLADDFLRVKVAALKRQVALALPEVGRPPVVQVSEWLAAAAGATFWEDQWSAQLAAGRQAEIVTALKDADVLEVVCRSGPRSLLRLQRQWLQSQED